MAQELRVGGKFAKKTLKDRHCWMKGLHSGPSRSSNNPSTDLNNNVVASTSTEPVVGVHSVLTLNHPRELEHNSQDRQDLVYQAELAERAERYSDMAESMKQGTELDIQLSAEERNSLALAYNDVIGHHRASLRKLTSSENEADSNDTRKDEIFMNYRERIKGEIRKICGTVLDILDKNLIPNSTTNEAQVFFYTMKGDYKKFLAEVQESAGRKTEEDSALSAYQYAWAIAKEEFNPANPFRLELALKLSIFHYEILNSPYTACHLAKTAYDDAVADLDPLIDENYRDSTLIMQLLRDKLALWTLDKPS